MIEEQIIPHPYTYRPARAIKEWGKIRWFDTLTGEELPPYFGYGDDVREKVDAWYKDYKEKNMTKYSLETTMTISEKVKFIREFLNTNYSNLDYSYFSGWYELLDLYGSNNLSHEFRMEMEKEINSIYGMVIESEFSKKKEKRIPALHTKGILCRFPDQSGVKSPYPRHFLRVNDDSKEGFTDYAITHYDLEVMILDGSAEFVQNEQGNFLDYTNDAIGPA